MGYVYEMNASTGKLIWKTPVGEHNGHDNDSLEALEHKLTLRRPYTIAPGSLGGVLTNMALAGNNVYVVTIDLPLTYTNLNRPVPTGVAGRPPERWRRSTSPPATSSGTRRSRHCRSAPPRSRTTLCSPRCSTATLLALNRRTGAIAYRRKLPTTENAPIAIAGHTVLVPAGGITGNGPSRNPQLVAYALR